MFVSWRCSSYGREMYVPKLIRQFLAQDYKGKKEFVLLNDDPDVSYVCEHPEVRIFNWDYRFDNLREKQNMCVSLCRGEVFYPVADDDIYEPWTTSRFVKEIGSDPFIACRGFWKMNKSGKRFYGTTIAGLYMCRADFYKKMGGMACWIWKHLGDLARDKSNNNWKLHPENFMERVRMSPRCYKEFAVNKKDAFYTWNRNANRDIWDMSDTEKFEIKKRVKKRISIKV